MSESLNIEYLELLFDSYLKQDAYLGVHTGLVTLLTNRKAHVNKQDAFLSVISAC